MPKRDDHPLRLARLRAGVSVQTLALRTGVARSTINAIEDGRTKQPGAPVLAELDNALSLPNGSLAIALELYGQADKPALLTLKQRAVLGLTPEQVRRYPSFQAWRKDLAPSTTWFASMVGLPRSTVHNYEKGVRVKGMPDTLASAIIRTFGVSNDYLIALQSLEPAVD